MSDRARSCSNLYFLRPQQKQSVKFCKDRKINSTMTLKMTTSQVVETSVTITNSSSQNYTHPDDHTNTNSWNSWVQTIYYAILTYCSIAFIWIVALCFSVHRLKLPLSTTQDLAIRTAFDNFNFKHFGYFYTLILAALSFFVCDQEITLSCIMGANNVLSLSETTKWQRWTTDVKIVTLTVSTVLLSSNKQS